MNYWKRDISHVLRYARWKMSQRLFWHLSARRREKLASWVRSWSWLHDHPPYD